MEESGEKKVNVATLKGQGEEKNKDAREGWVARGLKKEMENHWLEKRGGTT